MKNVEIEIFQIARTANDETEMRKWLDRVGATEYPVPEGLSGSEQVIGHAAKRCYMSFEPGLNPNVARVRKDWHQYFENIGNSGHGSVMEHGSYSYAIEGLTRVGTAELNRHRAGVAISEGSLRYIRFDDIPWWMPNTIRLTEEEEAYFKTRLGTAADTVNAEIVQSIHLKLDEQAIFNETFQFCQDQYVRLCDLHGINDEKTFAKKKIMTSRFRRIIPMGVSTGGVWTFNLRALRHVIALRTTEHAEEEIAYLFSLIAKDIIEREPRIMCDFEETDHGWVPKNAKV